MRMADGISWIAKAFKLFDALINPRGSPPPDQSVGTTSCEGLTPEAPADTVAAQDFVSIWHLRRTRLRRTTSPKLKLRRPNRSKARHLNGTMKVGANS